MQPTVFDAATPWRLVPSGKIAGAHRVHVAGEHQGGALLDAVENAHHVAELIGGHIIEGKCVHLIDDQPGGLAFVAAAAARPQQFLGERDISPCNPSNLFFSRSYMVCSFLAWPLIGWPVQGTYSKLRAGARAKVHACAGFREVTAVCGL